MGTTNLADYQDKYDIVHFEREDGILTMRLHSGDGPFMWTMPDHLKLLSAFADVAGDEQNEVVILTGTGDVFSGPRPTAPESGARIRPDSTPREWERRYREATRLELNLLDIGVPVICAVNGPAVRHAELVFLCDIVLASETAEFQDSVHFHDHIVPGDGCHVVYQEIMGIRRGTYFLMTGEIISAHAAHNLGIVNEVLPPDALMLRALELARYVRQRPVLVRRFTKILLSDKLRTAMHQRLGHGLALESLAYLDGAEAVS
ncbi:enoyl-CoA hydratase/isomerase family protein [Micromonospora sp. RTGN7]|uniref:enoyl-CoA hydratase/isomerase family protein n=1 Tax=Micromonospora sp. RTGN7 TaxID=3016526 RepID=UPI0029FF037C|nr:enoyl-CoA hydratase/isomerase family protein [Micromonospora sp. RTGN7]